jgi:HIV Tat-specific factor 1
LYIQPESVQLALQILDGTDIRGCKICVERAKFEMKGNFDPAKKKKKLSNKAKQKLKERQQK